MVYSLNQQLSFDLYEDWDRSHAPMIAAAIDHLSETIEPASRGAVFTRPEVVDFILDLAGYTVDQPIYQQRLLEPAFGAGHFLLPIVDRLVTAWQAAKGSLATLANAIHAVELHRETHQITYKALVDLLKKKGLEANVATALADRWLVQDDFLLTSIEGPFDFVIGNPPYVRQELIPEPLLSEYRHRYSTIYDRADLYIPFIERSLSLLTPKGILGFICSDRWMKNRYGGPLRRFIAEHFRLKIYVDMVDTTAFNSTVTAYPAITIISREKPGATRIAHCSNTDKATLTDLSKQLRTKTLPAKAVSKTAESVRELRQVTNGAEPWLLDSSAQIDLIRRLEQQFPRLEAVGCKVGIGVATGADKVFIGQYDALDVEPDRKLPLVTTKDIASGKVQWQGQGVINPFVENGQLVDLQAYPRLSNYLDTYRDIISQRHCAQKNPANWYRTIDRITPSLAAQPKLLIPDIKGEAHIVFEPGELYPHHNLYYVTAEQWELRALQAVMLSTITRLFIAIYSTKMRGGYFRFQAQYLRRICLPYWSDVPTAIRGELANAAIKRDINRCDQAVCKLYGLNVTEYLAIARAHE
jgi:Eco57I restriction-modification methylase/TaqI-like C-terminal specificity domain